MTWWQAPRSEMSRSGPVSLHASLDCDQVPTNLNKFQFGPSQPPQPLCIGITFVFPSSSSRGIALVSFFVSVERPQFTSHVTHFIKALFQLLLFSVTNARRRSTRRCPHSDPHNYSACTPKFYYSFVSPLDIRLVTTHGDLKCPCSR